MMRSPLDDGHTLEVNVQPVTIPGFEKFLFVASPVVYSDENVVDLIQIVIAEWTSGYTISMQADTVDKAIWNAKIRLQKFGMAKFIEAIAAKPKLNDAAKYLIHAQRQRDKK